eukprot:CAMPEP_0171278366 /NCGR_PEP_ID=MMETSP0790-20130122/64840_1 /TAXON_ID=2925 /ORGANISM="Alexandrium catenella, Strain OF101" /LENGTH=52 /DNA_ID=CAMNT_0011747537 /DNA_START=13 /DNA_END=171 /DNA_ORIENTATION=-
MNCGSGAAFAARGSTRGWLRVFPEGVTASQCSAGLLWQKAQREAAFRRAARL